MKGDEPMKERVLSGIKFEDVDLFDVMGRIVDSHVEHYRSDFDIDMKILREAADKEIREDRTYIWLCRTCGTWLLRERDVFIRNTREHNTYCFYADQPSDRVLAYAVEVTGNKGSVCFGNLYALDYAQHYQCVASSAQNPKGILFVYEKGQKIKPSDTHIYGDDDGDYGKFQYFEFQPENDEALSQILAEEHQKRKRFKTRNLPGYLTAIRRGKKQSA